MTILTTSLRAMRGWHRPLMVNVTLMFTLMLVSAVGMFVDDRMILGESIWLKPAKFGFGLGVYGLTLAWLLSKLRKGRPIGWWLGTIFAVAGLFDVGAVAHAAANGTFSHFNDNTDSVAKTVWNRRTSSMTCTLRCPAQLHRSIRTPSQPTYIRCGDIGTASDRR